MKYLSAAAIACAATMAGCATDSTGLTTSAIDGKTAPAAVASSKVDPACVTLLAQIDQLRKEGVVDRAQQVASKGKSSTVNVKRDSLAKLTELDRINADYQAKCSTISPATTTAQVATPQAPKAKP